MPITLRIFLIVGSILTLLFFINNIRKSKLKINHSIFWIVFGFALLLLALIPNGIFRIAQLLGFQSPSNLVYLAVIFLLLIKEFSTTMRISKLNEQLTALTQALALQRMEKEESETQPPVCQEEAEQQLL